MRHNFQMRDRNLDQFFTPEWAAIEIVESFFSDLTTNDFVIEPSCGQGAFLKAIPTNIPAIGVEIDPVLAEEAAANTGREILCGDFRTIELPMSLTATAILGNPPFSMETFDGFLDRAKKIMPESGRCGFILPCSACQTPSRVLRWNEDWRLEQNLLPRTLFQRARSPLMFLLFTKDKIKKMVGFALYEQAQDVNTMKKGKLVLIHGEPQKTCWRALVEWALGELGGSASLEDIYRTVEPKRISENQWWKEKVRQQLQKHFRRVEQGVWAI